MKTCSHCKTELPLDQFYDQKDKANGKTSWCKKCLKEKTAASRKDPSKTHIWSEYSRRSLLKRRYGITADDYDRMHLEQGGVCAICKVNTMGGRGEGSKLAVDHNHKTNQVRGLLCGMCNQGIGMFKDDVELMQRAIDYLKSYESSQSESS